MLPQLRRTEPCRITIDYAQPWKAPGLHVMHTPTDHINEIVSGLAARGVELIIAFTSIAPVQSHPIVPVLQIGQPQGRDWEKYLDIAIAHTASLTEITKALWPLLLQIYSGFSSPKLFVAGNTN